jgi:hypothetical protein
MEKAPLNKRVQAHYLCVSQPPLVWFLSRNDY